MRAVREIQKWKQFNSSQYSLWKTEIVQVSLNQKKYNYGWASMKTSFFSSVQILLILAQDPKNSRTSLMFLNSLPGEFQFPIVKFPRPQKEIDGKAVNEIRCDKKKIVIIWHSAIKEEDWILEFSSDEISKRWNKLIKKYPNKPIMRKRSRSFSEQNLDLKSQKQQIRMQKFKQKNNFVPLSQISQQICQGYRDQLPNISQEMIQLIKTWEYMKDDSQKYFFIAMKICAYEVKIKQLETKIQNLKEMLKRQQQNERLILRKNTIDIEKIQLQNKSSCLSLIKKLEDSQKLVQSLRVDLEQKTKRQSSLLTQISYFRSKFEDKQNDYLREVEEMSLQRTSSRQMMSKLGETTLKYQESENNYRKSKLKLAEVHHELINLNQQIKRLKIENSSLSLTLQDAKRKIQNLLEENYLHIFQGQVLGHYSLPHKKFLKESIQKYTKKEILRSRLLYAFDPLHKTNFHKYVDGHRDTILLIKTATGNLFGGYTVSAFQKDSEYLSQGGLIVSLTQGRSFQLIEGKRSIIYDDYYLIIGNSQIRIKAMEERVFSNFAISNGYYDSENCKVDILLGQGLAREVSLQTYQVHQIIYR